ncbi:histidine triad nucleotide-binding protein [Methylophaga sp. 42_25_T18]|nr:histidine triad nucleotide-binding protein [Methylophaga sp. 42_25_T18]OUR86467.1 histidine triad nucleotide-binding protein [Methylophaga sp. 42_8_T64]
MTDCLFCKIIAGDIPSSKVYEDEQIYVFKDIYPKAEVHILVVPKIHIKSLDELNGEHQDLIAKMTLKLPELARSQGLDTGFRTIINTGPGGGQEVDHLHMHILGGKNLPGFK